MFWLVLYYTSVVVIPEKYPTLEQCEVAGRAWRMPQQFACIPAAKSNVPNTCESINPGSNILICK